MNKQTLDNAVHNAKAETKEALQIVYDTLNQGQQKKNCQRQKSKGFVRLVWCGIRNLK
jgi:hypothetical protein